MSDSAIVGGRMDFLLRYEGELADQHELNFYDAAHALVGFQRSLALTAHFVLNGEIITHAPALKNATIRIETPKPGSWEVVAGLILSGAWIAANAKKDTPFVHLMYSAYDYAMRRVCGFPVDYNKSLYQSHEEYLESKSLTDKRFDALIEKIEPSVAEMHRPIFASHSADHANVFAGDYPDKSIMLGSELNMSSYEHLNQTKIDDVPTFTEGVVASYNRNTYGGRVYAFEEQRPVRFDLVDGSRSIENIREITTSLRTGATEKAKRQGAVTMSGHKVRSASGRLKSIRVYHVEPA